MDNIGIAYNADKSWPVANVTSGECYGGCGTAGFLVAASEYIQQHHGEAIYKDEASRRRFNEATFHGYDFEVTH